MNLIDVKVSRTIPATAAEVYDVWLDYKHPGGPWFGAGKVIVNPVVDGLFYHCAEHQGRIWPHYGRFVSLDRGRRVEYMWMSEGTKGKETMVTVAFEPKGKDCEVTILHSGLPEESGRDHEGGWTSILGAVADRIAKQR